MNPVRMIGALLCICAVLPATDLDAKAVESLRAALAGADPIAAAATVETAGSSLNGPNLRAVMFALLPDGRRCVRQAAALALGGQGADAVPLLAPLLGGDPWQRACGVLAASRAGSATHATRAIALASDADTSVRVTVAAACVGLAQGSDRVLGERALHTLITLSGDRDLLVRHAGIRALASLPQRPAIDERLTAVVCSAKEPLAGLALDEMVQAGYPTKHLIPMLVRGLHVDAGLDINLLAVDALSRIGANAEAEHLVPLLSIAPKDPARAELRAAICDALGRIALSHPGLVARVNRDLVNIASSDPWWGARLAAAWALWRLGSPDAVAATLDAYQHALGRADPAIDDLLCRGTGVTIHGLPGWQAWWMTTKQTTNGSYVVKPLPEDPPDPAASFFDIYSASRSVVYILDCSLSMSLLRPRSTGGGSETRQAAARREAARSVLMLRNGMQFNLVTFAGRVRTWRPAPVPATWRHRASAVDHLIALRLEESTNLHDAVLTGLAQPGVGVIYALTDGEPTAGVIAPAAILANLGARNRDLPRPVRIHTVPFGEDAPAAPATAGAPRVVDYRLLLERIATDSGGTCISPP